MSFGERLKSLRESKDLSQRELAQLFNIAPGTLGMYEIDKRKPDHDMLKKIATFFSVSTDYLLGRTHDHSPKDYRASYLSPIEQEFVKMIGTLQGLKFVPLIGEVPAGPLSLAIENVEERIPVPKSLDVDFALRVKGDSLSGVDIHDGAILLCKHDVDASTALNKPVIALCDGDQTTVKYLVQENGRWLLRAANPAYADIPIDEKMDRIQATVVKVLNDPPSPERTRQPDPLAVLAEREGIPKEVLGAWIKAYKAGLTTR